MRHALFQSLSLLDASGYIIIGAILLALFTGTTLTWLLRARYARIERDLKEHQLPNPVFETALLNTLVRDTLTALRRHPGEINTPALIDRAFQSELRGSLVAERFIRSATGLMIILGLVGTFYGLTLSIGKLVALVTGDLTATAEITDSLTRGLSEALSGMSVAFSTSLFGILSAIIMTLLNVCANVTDRRNALTVQIEAYLDNVLVNTARSELALEHSTGSGAPAAGTSGGQVALGSDRMEQMVFGFGQSVARLESAIGSFESALNSFSTTTRDFQEFNLHLKDNISRMSLSFGDMSDTLKQHNSALRSRDRG